MGALERALLLDIPETLETARLRLCAPQPGRGAVIHEAVLESFTRLRPWMPWARDVPGQEQSEKFCRESRVKWHARETLDFTVFRKEDGRLVGGSGLHTIDWSVPRFEIGYWIRASCERQGYASETVLALVDFARDRLGARRLEITSDARNAGSRRVAEKAGFALDAILRQRRRDNDDELCDACLFSRVF